MYSVSRIAFATIKDSVRVVFAIRSEDTCRDMIQLGIKIPLPDGVELDATLYAAQDAGSTRYPCVLVMTPYIADHYHHRALHFANAGFPTVVANVRGRGGSGGLFRPFVQESEDGVHVVDWLARQPYCNGQVAMSGGSYLGYAQWVTAKWSSTHLATIVPTAAPHIGTEFPMRNNIFHPYILRWLALTFGRSAQLALFADSQYWGSVYRAWHKSGRPFRELDCGPLGKSEIFQEWLLHPHLGEFWDRYNPTPAEYARISIPVLTITGSYDDDQPGALAHYNAHLATTDSGTERSHYLVIGPWDHRGTSAPMRDLGGMKLGEASMLDLSKLHVDWYSWIMRGAPKPAFLKNRVAYYVLGAECWKYSSTLRDVTVRHDALFLNSSGNPNGVASPGGLSPSHPAGGPDSYTYALDDLGDAIDTEAASDPRSLTDVSVTNALEDRQLIYHSAPFSQDVEVSGFFRVTAWIAMDCADADLYVSIYEIAEDGTSIRLSTDAIRARYREDLRKPILVGTRAPLRYEFSRFTFVSRLIRSGSRLRLIFAPMGRLIEEVFVEKNYGAGGVIASEGADVAKPITIKVFHDMSRPSALFVPIGADCRGRS